MGAARADRRGHDGVAVALRALGAQGRVALVDPGVRYYAEIARSPGTDRRLRGSVPAVLLSITTTGKVTLLIVAGAFIAWALITAIWIPKRNPEFPVTLTAFVLVSALFLVAQLGAVYWVTSTQEVAKEAVGAETTPAETTPAGAAGDPVAGKAVFMSAGCVNCHTLADAGATGTVGPNLDEKKPPAELVVERVTNGKGVMPTFKGTLTEQQIKDVTALLMDSHVVHWWASEPERVSPAAALALSELKAPTGRGAPSIYSSASAVSPSPAVA